MSALTDALRTFQPSQRGEQRHFENDRLVAVHPQGERCERCPGGSLDPLAHLRQPRP